MKKTIFYQVTEAEENKTLGWVLHHCMEFSRREISRAKFHPEGICVNGVRRTVTAVVKQGDRIEVCLEEGNASEHLQALTGSLHICYEDDDVLVVDKPAGMVCHPAGGHYGDTLANLVRYHCQREGCAYAVRMVGRLDRETSGLVLLAKSRAAALRLSRQKEMHVLRKEYLALVDGCPEWLKGGIRRPIGPAEAAGGGRDKIRMEVRPDGKDAYTEYRVVRCWEDSALLRIHITTGRTHQIRVHMASVGHPLLGDSLYGDETGGSGFERAALHAGGLEFFQPFTKEKIQVEAELPEDFQKYLRERNQNLCW